MHLGILKVGAFALGLTLAPDVSAQTGSTKAAPIAGHQVLTAKATAMAVAVPRLPNVVGFTADSASRLLTNAGLAVVRRDMSSSAAPRDQVIDQQPAAGTPLSAIRQVTVVVAIPPHAAGFKNTVVATMAGGVIVPPSKVSTVPPAGPSPSSVVPLLLGRNARSAPILVTEVGLRLDPQVVNDFSDVAAPGFIFHQDPQPQVRVDTGSLVKIWVSLGPHRAPMTVTTPDVVGTSLGVADRILRGAQLVVGHVDTVLRTGARGQVEHQLPEAGSRTHPGDAVALSIAMAPLLVQVPSVIGLQRAEARLALREAGLALGQVTPVIMSGRDTVIVGQKPAAFTGVVRGTFVDVEENQPVIRRRTVVPNLGGMTSASAAQRLSRDSLTLGSVVVSDNGDAAVVVAQRPMAGEPAFFYDAVSITLASPRPVLPPPAIVGTTPTAPLAPTPRPVVPPSTSAPPTPSTKVSTGTITPPAAVPPTPTIPLVRVPQVTNMPFEGARRLIDGLGLVTVSTNAATGRTFVVRSQRPDSGSLVPFGAQVALVLDSLDVPPVPHLVGLRRAAAEDRANADGFTLTIQNQHRVLMQLFEEVSSQEPTERTIARGDVRILVDLATPLFPPLPAAIVLVLAAAGTAATVRIKHPPSENSLPVSDLHFALETTSAPAVLSPVPDDRVIRTAVTFTLDTDRGEWTIDSADTSLVSHIKTHV
ncbi:MAG: pknL [Gemmatimonadetes bacterium]|nr:pknL [Gemmatimonadota bacterium]